MAASMCGRGILGLRRAIETMVGRSNARWVARQGSAVEAMLTRLAPGGAIPAQDEEDELVWATGESVESHLDRVWPVVGVVRVSAWRLSSEGLVRRGYTWCADDSRDAGSSIRLFGTSALTRWMIEGEPLRVESSHWSDSRARVTVVVPTNGVADVTGAVALTLSGSQEWSPELSDRLSLLARVVIRVDALPGRGPTARAGAVAS